MTIFRSSCYFCQDKRRIIYYFKLTSASDDMSIFFNQTKVITLYSNVFYDGREEAIECMATLKEIGWEHIEDEWEVEARCEMKNPSSIRLGKSCTNEKFQLNDQFDRECSMNCSLHSPEKIPCSMRSSTESTQSSQITNGPVDNYVMSTLTMTLAGGVVGGIVGGVVITVVVVAVCRNCKKRRSQKNKTGNDNRDSHIYLRLFPNGNTLASGASTDIPDVVKISETSATDEMSHIYQEIPDYPNFRQEECMPDPQRFQKPESGQTTGTHHITNGNNAYNCVVLENDGASHDTSNKLLAEAKPSSQKFETYNTLGEEVLKQGSIGHAEPFPEYFVLENSGASDNRTQ